MVQVALVEAEVVAAAAAAAMGEFILYFCIKTDKKLGTVGKHLQIIWR
jgi:hypothetical protein